MIFREKIRPVLLKFNIINEKTEEWVFNSNIQKSFFAKILNCDDLQLNKNARKFIKIYWKIN